MNYVIFQTKSGPQLGWYNYHWPSDSFTVGLGTTQKHERHSCDLNYKILARLFFKRQVTTGYFTYNVQYPKDNFLRVTLEDGVDAKHIPDIAKMKGFKKFFGDKNIKEIVFA